MAIENTAAAPAAATPADLDTGVTADVLALLDQGDAALPPPPPTEETTEAPVAGGQVAPVAPAPAAPPLKAFEERFAELATEKAKLAEREAAIAARETALPDAAAFQRDPMAELRRMAIAVVGNDEAKLAAFLAQEVYEPLMVELVGMKDPDKLDPTIRLRADQRRLARELDAEKRAREDGQRELARQKEAAAEEAKLQQIKGTLSRWIEGKGSDYPHLAKYSPNAADDVFSIMVERTDLTPQQAAESAEAHYKRERARYASDQLLAGRPAAAAGTNAMKTGQSTATTSTRASLTNSGATEGNATETDAPPTDPEASAAFWADRLERDPESIRKLSARRR